MKPNFWPRTILFLMIACAAGTQEDLQRLTDAQVLEQMHRREMRDEFRRRLKTATPERQRTLTEGLEQSRPPKRFPTAYEAGELMPYLTNSEDFRSRSRATKELRGRYERGDVAQREQIVQALRMALRDDFNATEGTVLRSPTTLLTGACGQILPTDALLDLFEAIYLAEESPGHLTAFFYATQHANVMGPRYGELLVALYERVRGLNADTLRQMGEYEELPQLVIGALSRGGDPAYNFLLQLDWEGSPLCVSVLATFDKPEVTGMLMTLYGQTPPPRVDRLQILSALNTIWRRNQDEEVRDFIRIELPQFLQPPPEGSPLRRRVDAIQVAGATKDPFFAPYLHSLASEVQAMTTYRTEYPFEYEGFEKSVREALRQLQSSEEEL